MTRRHPLLTAARKLVAETAVVLGEGRARVVLTLPTKGETLTIETRLLIPCTIDPHALRPLLEWRARGTALGGAKFVVHSGGF